MIVKVVVCGLFILCALLGVGLGVYLEAKEHSYHHKTRRRF
jgi:uncharacterized membrane protein YsdA (DUF1294 family)